MARFTKKSATQEIAQALNTPVNLNWRDVAEELGVTIPDLQERFAAKLNDATVFTWDTIPVEHQAVVDAIARDLESEASVRRLESEKPLPEGTEQALEPPLLEEEVQPNKRGGRTKKAATALTKKKTESLQKSDQKSQQLAASDVQIKQALHVKKGQKSGAQLATLELAAEDATYRSIKGQALVRKVAQLSSELAAESDFDPIQVLKDNGIEPNDEILEALREQIEPTLGKFQTAVEEITANAWVNPIELGTEFSQLESLLNSNN
jgi:hypothetical protein